MKSLLLRSASTKVSVSGHDFVAGAGAGFVYGERNGGCSPRVLMNLGFNDRRGFQARSIGRVSSDPDVVRSELSRMSSLPAKIREVEEEEEDVEGSHSVLRQLGFDRVRDWPENVVPVEELGFTGGGMGKGKNIGGGGGDGGGDCGNGPFTGGNADQSKIGAYYERMLKLNPGDPLLLRNYGKFLHEVEKDTARAEEYYGRALLASPGDGELLSLYGTLIWETQNDGQRAKTYFDQAIIASPEDCTVMGSYAHFMWEVEEDEEDIGTQRGAEMLASTAAAAAAAAAAAMVKAF